MPRAKRETEVLEAEPDEDLDRENEPDTLSGAVPEGELALARSVASKMGWTPKEEWKRDPAKWVDAPDFLENTPRILADLKERSERTARAAAEAIEEERRRKAEEATRVIRESDDPEERAKAAQRLAENAGPPPQTQAWLAKNPWFHADPDAQALAVATVNRLAQTGASITDQLEEAEKRVRQRFPEYFSAGTETRLSDIRRQAPTPPQVQQGSRATTTQPKERGFAQIPRADREAFNLHLRKAFMSRGLTAEQAEAKYAEGYWKEPVTPPDERPEDPWVKDRKSNPWGRR